MRYLPPLSSVVSFRLRPEPSMTTSVRLHRRTCGFERQNVGNYDIYVHMSPRTFARLFKQQTGETPGRYMRRLRGEAARRRTHELSGSAETVAAQVGFGSTRSLQRSLRGTSRARLRKT